MYCSILPIFEQKNVALDYFMFVLGTVTTFSKIMEKITASFSLARHNPFPLRGLYQFNAFFLNVRKGDHPSITNKSNEDQ